MILIRFHESTIQSYEMKSFDHRDNCTTHQHNCVMGEIGEIEEDSISLVTRNFFFLQKLPTS